MSQIINSNYKKNLIRMEQPGPNKSCPQQKISFPMHPEPTMNEPGMCKSSIGAGSSLGLKYFVTKENFELSWKIKLKRGSIKLSFYRRPIRQRDAKQENVSSLSCQEKSKNDKVPALCEEDMSKAVEEVEASKRISSSKEFVSGSLNCESGYVYTAVMSNRCVLFSSITVFYCIELVTKDGGKNNLETGTMVNKPEMEECRNIRLLNDSAERKACIEDLLHFVSEISLAEQGATILSAKDRDQLKAKILKASTKETSKSKDNPATEKAIDSNNQKSPKDVDKAEDMKETPSTKDTLPTKEVKKEPSNESNSPKKTKNVAS